jgi:hypothetical protein
MRDAEREREREREKEREKERERNREDIMIKNTSSISSFSPFVEIL